MEQAENREETMLSSVIKNKAAGLQNYYFIKIEAAMIVTLLTLITVFKAPIYPVNELNIQQTDQETVKMEEIIQTKQPESPPPPPRPVVPVEVPNDEVIHEEILSFNSEIDFDAALELPKAPPSLPDREKQEEESEQEIFVIVERMPELIGGLEEVQKKVHYPEMALQAGIEGRVVIQFVIDEKGRPINPVVVRGIGGGCDEEALRVVKTLQFTPGLQRGKPVKVRFTLPIVFKLRNK